MLAGLLFELHPSVSVSLYIHRLSYILLARDIYHHLPPIGKLSKNKKINPHLLQKISPHLFVNTQV